MKLINHTIIGGIALSCLTAILLPVKSYGQIGKYKKLACVGKSSFNFNPASEYKVALSKNKDVLIVFSDRDANKAYANQYAQRVLGEQKIGTPFYVIDEKNGFCKVTTASPQLLGKPKGFFSPLYGSKRHLKDARNAPFIGWIPKEHLLRYNHAFVSAENNRPIRYRVGASAIKRLFKLRPFCNTDTLIVYKDPFLRDKTEKGVLLGQIVYAYKYDESKQAVLIADKPTLADSSRTVLGWVPADMIAEIGQNRLYIAPEQNVDGTPLQSDLLFAFDGNKNVSSPINMPVAVWDRNKSKIINIKGKDFPVSEIEKMIKGSKNLNIHVLFFDKDRAEVRAIASSLQSISQKVPAGFNVNYTLTAISDKGNRYLKATPDYAEWLSFFEKALSHKTNDFKGTGLQAALNKILTDTPYVKFENNVFIFLGTDEVMTWGQDTKSRLAKRGASLLFVQLEGKEDTAYQNFILQSKELLDANIANYMSFITNYIADPDWDKPSLFTELGTDDENAYLLDAPKKSVATGGLIFPKVNGKLSNPGFNKVLDTLFIQIQAKDEEMIASLVASEKKLGVMRAIPSDNIRQLCEQNSRTLSELDRNSIHDVLYIDTQLKDSTLSQMKEGYLFDAAELKAMLEAYREMMPHFAKTDKKELGKLKRFYYRFYKQINKALLRKVLSSNSSVSDLFYYKTGIPSSNTLNDTVKLKDLTPKKFEQNHWDEYYIEMNKKLAALEDLFRSGKLKTIEIAGTTYYFIPKQEML